MTTMATRYHPARHDARAVWPVPALPRVEAASTRIAPRPAPVRGTSLRGPVAAACARRTVDGRRRAYAFGLEAERFVAQFLRAGGYAILACRERSRTAEVDIVAARDDIVAFVEVKARRQGWSGLESVDVRKRTRIARAAREWLSEHPAFGDCTIRFDVALVWPGPGLDYLESAFEDEEPVGFVW